MDTSKRKSLQMGFFFQSRNQVAISTKVMNTNLSMICFKTLTDFSIQLAQHIQNTCTLGKLYIHQINNSPHINM